MATSGITSTGMGTGLNITDIVQKLVDAEGQPKFQQLDTKQTTTNDRLSAIGSLKSALTAFQTASKALQDSDTFLKHATASSNESIITATADTKAVPGNYSIVVDHLATRQRLVTGGTGFASGSATVGTGTLTIQVGSDSANSFNVSIDTAHQSLASIRDAINSAADNKGVSASIINVDDGSGGKVSRLVFSSKNTGLANTITVTAQDDDGNNTDAAGLSQLSSSQLTEQTPARDALVKINGYDVTRSSNTISDAVDGLTFTLNAAAPTSTVDIDVTVDNSAISKNVNDFVKAFNNLSSVIKNLGNYDSTTKTAGVLLGDSMLSNLKSLIRTDLSTPVTGATSSYSTLQMLGIEIDSLGTMSLKQDKFDAALAADPSSVSVVFTASDGVAKRVSSRIDPYVQTGGIFDSRTQQLNSTLRQIENSRTKEQDYLDALQKRLLKQFNAMDSMVARINSTGSYLTQQLSALNKISSSK
jgi:flagellar hook-associated protein 2